MEDIKIAGFTIGDLDEVDLGVHAGNLVLVRDIPHTAGLKLCPCDSIDLGRLFSLCAPHKFFFNVQTPLMSLFIRSGSNSSESSSNPFLSVP